MTNIELVRLYNRLCWYFTHHAKNGKDDIKTKMSDPCDNLLKELNKFYDEENNKEVKEK